MYEFCLDDKNFIKQNFAFFKDLTFFLINDQKIKDGRVLTSTWNQTFLATFKKHFPTSSLGNELTAPAVFNDDPIEHAHNIGQVIDTFFIANNSEKGNYRNMELDKSLIPSIESPKKKGFLKNLLRK